MKRKAVIVNILFLLFFGLVATSSAIVATEVIAFEELAHNELITTQYQDMGVTFEPVSPSFAAESDEDQMVAKIDGQHTVYGDFLNQANIVRFRVKPTAPRQNVRTLSISASDWGQCRLSYD